MVIKKIVGEQGGRTGVKEKVEEVIQRCCRDGDAGLVWVEQE